MVTLNPSPLVLPHHLLARAYPRNAIRSASLHLNAFLRRATVGSPPPSVRSSLRLGSTLVAPLFFDTPYALKVPFVGQLVGHMSDNYSKTCIFRQ